MENALIAAEDATRPGSSLQLQDEASQNSGGPFGHLSVALGNRKLIDAVSRAADSARRYLNPERRAGHVNLALHRFELRKNCPSMRSPCFSGRAGHPCDGPGNFLYVPRMKQLEFHCALKMSAQGNGDNSKYQARSGYGMPHMKRKHAEELCACHKAHQQDRDPLTL